jgi:hypothetical protein
VTSKLVGHHRYHRLDWLLRPGFDDTDREAGGRIERRRVAAADCGKRETTSTAHAARSLAHAFDIRACRGARNERYLINEKGALPGAAYLPPACKVLRDINGQLQALTQSSETLP